MCCVKPVSILRCCLVLLGLFARTALAAPPQAEVLGQPELVFTGGQGSACGADFIPDAPARAFRTADGRVTLMATYYVDRVLRGADLDHLKPDCQIVYRGAENTDPALFNGHDWIAAPYTLDGRTVYGLVHDEYWGQQRPDLCPAAKYMSCWYNRVTSVVSTDGGASFHRSGLIAVPPYPYDGTLGRHVGYFNPSNIIEMNGWYYATFFATQWKDQGAGNCLMHTNRLDEPGAWRGWDGKEFSVQFVDPYRSGNFDPAKHVCAPLPQLHAPIGSIVRHRPSGRYIANMAAKGGFFISTSSDLRDWTPPQLLWSVPLSGEQGCDHPWVANYPALLDSASPDRNFDSVGDEAWLYFTRFWTKDCGLSMQRDLMRIKVRLSAG